MKTATALLFTIMLTAPADAEIIDRILAVAEGHLITLSDVRAVLRLGLVTVPEDQEDRIGAALDTMIERRLILTEVERYAPPEPAPATVDARVAAIDARFGDALALEVVLTQLGMTRQDLRRHVRDDLRIDAYLQQRFASAAPLAADRERLVREWMEGLKRRGNLVKLYLPGKQPG